MRNIQTLCKKLFPVVGLLLMACSTGLHAQTVAPEGSLVAPTHPHIRYVGRISFRHPDAPCFTYPGVQIRARFTGTSLRMMAKPMSGYFMARIDDARPYKVSFNAPLDSIVTLATALPEGEHSVELMYIIEGYQRRAEFRGFLLDEGARLTPPAALPERRIEFIGNSITCGFGNESLNPADPYMDETENHYYTYAARTARALGAQHLVVARSGIGVYRNYNGPRTGSPDCMPAMYDQTLFTDTTEVWDYTRYVPDVVCINLGTNDTSTHNYDTTLLRQAYARFIRQVRSHYPQAKIVMLTGSMMSGQELADVKEALAWAVGEIHRGGDREVYRFDLSPQTGDLGYGACSHPSLRQHEKMADELTRYLRELMGW